MRKKIKLIMIVILTVSNRWGFLHPVSQVVAMAGCCHRQCDGDHVTCCGPLYWCRLVAQVTPRFLTFCFPAFFLHFQPVSCDPVSRNEYSLREIQNDSTWYAPKGVYHQLCDAVHNCRAAVKFAALNFPSRDYFQHERSQS